MSQIILPDSAGQSSRYSMDQEGKLVAASMLLSTAKRKVTSDAAAALQCIEQAQSLLGVAESAATPARGGLAGWQIERLRRYIFEHIEEPIRIVDLTAVARLSAGHFSKAFKKSFGMPPHAFVVACRIRYAERLLATETLSICAIAVDCGFCDQAHFSRQFRRATGLAPAAWRRLNASGSAG